MKKFLVRLIPCHSCRFRLLVIPASILCLCLVTCSGQTEPDSGEKQDEPYLRCAELRSDGQRESFNLPPLEVTRSGYDLSIKGINRGLVVVGVLAGISESTEANLKNVDLFLKHFKDAAAQVIVAIGGVGYEPDDVQKVLKRLANAPVPILVVPGDQENLDVVRREIALLRQSSPQIIDMTLVRRARIGNLTMVSVPGYYRPFYLKAGKRGCSYNIDDLQETASLFEQDRTSLVLSPTPPRGSSEKSVDRSRSGVNIGDPELAEVMAASGARFGIFGYAYEAGGMATLDDGRTAVAHAIWQESLFVQAGAAEAIPISTVGEGRSAGMAQILEFSGNRARYRTIYASR